VKRQQRLKLKRARRRRNFTAIMVTVIGGLIVLWIRDLQKKIDLSILDDETPPVESTPDPGPEPPPPPTATHLASLLKTRRDEDGVRDAFTVLGRSREEPVDQGGKAFCFRHRGVELLFDSEDRLNKVRLFSGLPDEHQHAAYNKDYLPFGVQFGMFRSEAQKQIEKRLHRKVVPELGVGECDKFELKEEGYNLYLLYGEFDGDKRLREVQLLRLEDYLQQHAALAGRDQT
jgi:hypothetical protein